LLHDLLEQETKSVGTDCALFDITSWAYRSACERISRQIDFHFHLHDLRRTFATTATKAGIDAGMVKRLMNHSSSGDVTAHHYVKLSAEDLRPAMLAVEQRLCALWGAHQEQ
jgi:integrase